MPRPATFILLYLIWGNGLLLHGWLGLFGSDCFNSFALLEVLLANWGQPPTQGVKAFFCFQEALGVNAIWMGILFYSLLPGLLSAICLGAWDRYRGLRHIDLQV